MADITLGSPTIIFKSVFGNKRVVVATLTFGTGSLTWPVEGLSFLPETLGMTEFEFVKIDSDGQLCYYYDYTNHLIKASTAHAATAGANVLMVVADDATPAAGTIRLLCVGYGAF
jgi:hypothetical protein